MKKPNSSNKQSIDKALSKQSIESAIQDKMALTLKEFGDACIQELIERARHGIRYDGQKQRPNAPSTLKQKAAKGQGSTPLVATQELINPSNYFVRMNAANKFGITIEPSPRIKEILKYLGEMPDPYEFLGIPVTIRGVPVEQFFQELLNRNTNNIHI